MTDNYTNYGTANGWHIIPVQVSECSKAGHVKKSVSLDNCYTEYSCPQCKYKYKVDSND